MKSNRHTNHSPPPLQRAPTSTPTTATVPISSLAPIAPPPRLEPTLPDGLRMGSFEIKGVISQSRAAVVYRAVDHALSTPAAIKEFMPAGVARRGRGDLVEPVEPWHEDTVDLGRRAFLAEARALARCDDPALLRVTQLWEINGTAYRVMPLYSGKRLADLRRHMKAPIDEYALRAMLERLLSALEAFHAGAGVHGNVNPANILMPSLDRPVLLGTGRTGMLLATELGESGRTDFEAAFAAPEQHDEGATVGVSADLFGLAQTLRYCITGGAPIGHESLRAAIHRTLGAGAVSSYSDALLDALTSATALAPGERPQTLDEFRQRLRRLEAQGAAAATPAAPATAPAASPDPGPAAATGSAAASAAIKPAEASVPPVVAVPAAVPGAAPTTPTDAPTPPTATPPGALRATPAPIAAVPPSPEALASPEDELDEPVAETIDVSSVLGDLMQGPAETAKRPAAPAAERAEARPPEPRVEPTLNFSPVSPGLRISELPDRVPRPPAGKPQSAPGATTPSAAAAFAGAAEASPDSPFTFHAYGFDNPDPSLRAEPVPARHKRSLWQALRLGVFVTVLAGATVVTILAVTGVWDPRGPELKLPPLHAPE
ncbi:MAG TPA: hypothetical protein VJO99_23035, partial [Burkholderiaceae bacterium]|nr:hypothetical protein [Burkholderiaceae bacterium]